MASRYNTSAGEKGQMVSRSADSMFASPSAMSDITLIVDGKKLHVSKCVLGLASPVFLKMFEGDFKDKTEIPLADKKYEDMVELLLCIYPSTHSPITRKSLETLLPLADEYGIESVKGRCEEYLLTELHDDRFPNRPNEELVHFLYLADKYKLNKLFEAGVVKAKGRSFESEIKRLTEFNLMSWQGKFRVTSARLCDLETPMTDLLIQAQKKPLGVIINNLINPRCSGCIHGEDSHDKCKCQFQSVDDLKALFRQLGALSVHFPNDPRVKKNQK